MKDYSVQMQLVLFKRNNRRDAGGRKEKILTVEGSSHPRRHRHVTISRDKRHDSNVSGDVTKIELELAETPDNTILVGPMPSELDTTTEINSTYTDGIPGTGTVVVRTEEALIVVLVLVLWVAAIALFFNRWGKIRMLEPYQPKFQQQHRQSCAEPNPVQHRSYSKFNIHCIEHPSGHQTSCVPGFSRPRQNSVFVGSSASLLACQDTPRRAKSAFDLQSLVLAECAVPPRDSKDEQINVDSLKTLKPIEPLRTRDRRTSVCQFDRTSDVTARFSLQQDRIGVYQFDRTDVLARPMQRDRGMSICQFDRMDVLARPLQRDRGMSICQFDRTDVLARPFQRDRGNSICQFDRMEVLARPTYVSRSRERRVSVCNFLEKDEEASGRWLHRVDRRLSCSTTDKVDRGKERAVSMDKYEGSKIKEKNSGSVNAVYQYDRPSCSKTPNVVLGYKATCV